MGGCVVSSFVWDEPVRGARTEEVMGRVFGLVVRLRQPLVFLHLT